MLKCHKGPSPLTCASCAIPHYQTKKIILFACLPWHSYLPQCGYSLLLSHMACTQWFQFILASFGWYIIPAGQFPKKSLIRNPTIDFPPFPTTRSCPILPLSHDPPLPVFAGYMLVMYGPCACSTSVYVQNLSAAHVFAMVWRLVCIFCHSSLTSYGKSYFLISRSLWPAPFRGWALLDCGPFFLQPSLLPLMQSGCHFLPYHSAIPVVMLFELSLLCLFESAAYTSLNESIQSLDSYSCYFGLFYYIACGLFFPIYFFLGILSPFAFLGHPQPFF